MNEQTLEERLLWEYKKLDRILGRQEALTELEGRTREKIQSLEIQVYRQLNPSMRNEVIHVSEK